jgi:hypothetical protein
MIDLTLFVAAPAQRGVLNLFTPWRKGAWVYATNRHMIVRVPAETAPADTPDFTPGAHPKNAEGMFDAAFALTGDFMAWPALPPLEVCSDCKGTGVDPSAPEDEEDDGLRACLRCDGTGYAYDRIEVAGVGFKLQYLVRLAQLPQSRIFVTGPSTPSCVVFDGGQGLVMPLSPAHVFPAASAAQAS